MDIRNKKINFLGDSITEGVGVTSPEYSYVEVFRKKYSPALVRNYGISGTRIARQKTKTTDNPSFDQDFCSRVNQMDADADIVVVFGGVNDFGHGDAPFGTFEDRTPETFYGACHTLIISLIERFPHATIVFMTPLHGICEARPNKQPLHCYVSAIREVAQYYAIPVLDLYTTSGLQPMVPVIRKKYMPDGVHPNNAGAEKIADRLAGFLNCI